MRIGKTNGIFAPPPRERTPPEPPSATCRRPRLVWGVHAHPARRGLDMRHRMGEGRAVRGDVWGRHRERRIGKAGGGVCWCNWRHSVFRPQASMRSMGTRPLRCCPTFRRVIRSIFSRSLSRGVRSERRREWSPCVGVLRSRPR